jgi:hypothetical protein
MAGNTKLLGLSPDNSINLSRWGKEVKVRITKESMLNIRNALAGLPSKPPEQSNDSNSFKVHYDESVGRVLVDMDPATAMALVDKLEFFRDEEVVEELGPWVHSLRAATKAHEDYHNVQGEPGV